MFSFYILNKQKKGVEYKEVSVMQAYIWYVRTKGHRGKYINKGKLRKRSNLSKKWPELILLDN